MNLFSFFSSVKSSIMAFGKIFLTEIMHMTWLHCLRNFFVVYQNLWWRESYIQPFCPLKVSFLIVSMVYFDNSLIIAFFFTSDDNRIQRHKNTVRRTEIFMVPSSWLKPRHTTLFAVFSKESRVICRRYKGWKRPNCEFHLTNSFFYK